MDKIIDLINTKSKDRRRAYSADEAAAILAYEEAQGYKGHKLPDDSKYTFTDGKLIERSSSEIDKGASKPARNKSGAEQEGQA